MQLYQPPGARQAARAGQPRGSGGGGGGSGRGSGRGGRGGGRGRHGVSSNVDETRAALGGRGGRGGRRGGRGGRGDGSGGMLASLSDVTAVQVDLAGSGIPIAEFSIAAPELVAAEQKITATPSAAEREADAGAAAAAAEQQRQERLNEVELLQELEQEREQQASGMHNDASPADENAEAQVFSNDADDAIERFEAWLELVLDNQHGIVGDTATMYVSFAVALLQLEEKGGSTLEQLAEVKLAALDTLFGELSSEDARSKESNDPDRNALGTQCWGFWVREVLPRMQDEPMSCDVQDKTEPNDSRECSAGTAQDGVLPEPEPEQASEKRVDPSDGVAYEYASFEQVYGPLRAPELWIKAGELMNQADASGTSTEGSGGAYIPPHKKGKKKGSKKGVVLSLDELGFLFQGPSTGGRVGSTGLSSSSSDSWSHDCYEAGRADFGRTGGRSWRSEERMGSHSSDRLRGDSFRPRASYSSTPRAGGSMSSMSYGGLARSSVRSGGGGGTGSRDSASSNRPSSSTEVAHRMIMHVLRSQMRKDGVAKRTSKDK